MEKNIGPEFRWSCSTLKDIQKTIARMDRRADSTLTFIRNEVKLSKYSWQRNTKAHKVETFFYRPLFNQRMLFSSGFSSSPSPFPSLFLSQVLSCIVDTRLHASFELRRQKRLSNGLLLRRTDVDSMRFSFWTLPGKKRIVRKPQQQGLGCICVFYQKRKKKKKKKEKEKRKGKKKKRGKSKKSTYVFGNGCKIHERLKIPSNIKRYEYFSFLLIIRMEISRDSVREKYITSSWFIKNLLLPEIFRLERTISQ